MKNLLIVAPYFGPQNKIAAIRPTKIAKYLNRNGKYHVIVLTYSLDAEVLRDIPHDPLLEKDVRELSDVFPLSVGRFSNFVNRLVRRSAKHKPTSSSSQSPVKTETAPAHRSPFRQWLSAFTYIFLDLLNSWGFYRAAKKKIRQSNWKIDAIFSTYGPYASQWVGRYAKRHYPNACWIADFRDAVQQSTPWPFSSFAGHFAEKCCKTADAITAVSEGVLQELNISESSQKNVLPNGFDKEDLEDVPAQNENEALTFLYTGSIYRGKSDLRPVFQALSLLITQKEIDPEYIHIQYAGQHFADFYSQAKQFHIEELVEDCGYIPRQKSLQLQANADILLLASWNTVNSTGIVTGKFLEYLMMNKNIVCCMSGNIPNSQLKVMIQNARCGFCCEEAGGSQEVEALKTYLQQKYMEKKEAGYCSYSPDQQWIQQYDYQHITNQLMRLFGT